MLPWLFVQACSDLRDLKKNDTKKQCELEVDLESQFSNYLFAQHDNKLDYFFQKYGLNNVENFVEVAYSFLLVPLEPIITSDNQPDL